MMTQDNKTRLYLDSIMLAFLIWLVLNPLITALSPEMTPFIQSAMFSHGDIGTVFLVFVIFYFPAHIYTSQEFSCAATKKIFSHIAGFIIIMVVYFVLVFFWEHTSKYSSIFVLTAAFILFERAHRQRTRARKMTDLLATFILIYLSLHATRDGLIRHFIIVLLAYSLIKTVSSAFHLIQRKKEDATDYFGVLGFYLSIYMFMFALMMAGGTNSGKYPYTPVMDYPHYVTAIIFTTVIFVHLAMSAKKLKSQNKKPVSIPVVLLAFFIFISWETRNAFFYKAYATPILDVSSLKPEKASRYTNVQGYYHRGKNNGFIRSSATCATTRCHPELSEQHHLSAHGRAMENNVFKWQLKIFIREKGRAAADYCIACHAPLGVIEYPGDGSRGKIIDPLTTDEPSFTLGVGCVVCHRAMPEKEKDAVGNCSLTIKPNWLEKERYLGEETKTPEGMKIHQSLIHAANVLHRKTYHVKKEEWDYICAACHVVHLPASLSADGKEHRNIADHYTSFADSPYAKAGLSCASCHQQRFVTYEIGYDTVSHLYLGSGSSLPYGNTHDDKTFRAVSTGFLKGIGNTALFAAHKNDLPLCLDDIDAYKDRHIMLPQRGPGIQSSRTNGGLTRRDLLKTSLELVSLKKNSVHFIVRTQNDCVGHAFPSGGGIKGFLEVKLYDDKNHVIATYGGRGKNGLPVTAPTNLGVRTVDKNGKPITDRHFWNAVKAIYKKYLNPGEIMSNDITLTFTEDEKPSRMEARWYYLRPEFFRNHERGITKNVPPVLIGSATFTLKNIHKIKHD